MTHENIFNDQFVASVADELLQFELPASRKATADGDNDPQPPLVEEKIQRLASLFSPLTHSVTPTLNNFNVNANLKFLIDLVPVQSGPYCFAFTISCT